MDNTEKQIARYLSPFSDELVSLATQLRKYLIEETKPGVEIVADTYNSLNFGYGFTETAWDCYCAIIIYSKHINISLPSGSVLADPTGILHGTGSRVRHIKISTMADVKSSATKKILNKARAHAFSFYEGEEPKHGPSTVIKKVAGKKRRRS